MDVFLKIPTTWNQLSHQQFSNIVVQLESYHEIIKADAKAVEECSTKLYLQLAKELLRHNKISAIKTALKEIQPKAFKELTQFIYKKTERTKFKEILKIKGTAYYAPAIRLRNCTIAEFSFADAAFYKWRHTNQPIWLNVLCACLYREAAPTPTDIDLRKPFLKQAVDARADIFEHVNYKTKLAIAYTYEGSRNHISSTFPRTFPKPVVVEGETPIPQKYVSFGEIILDKIKGDPAKLAITNNVFVYDFLSIIENDIKNFKRQK